MQETAQDAVEAWSQGYQATAQEEAGIKFARKHWFSQINCQLQQKLLTVGLSVTE